MLTCCQNGFAQNYYAAASKEYFYGDLNKAVELFTRSIENSQELPKSYMYRGAAECSLNRFPEALTDLNKSFRLDPANDKIYYYYGKYHLLSGTYTQAIRFYDTAISKNPNYAAAYDERAIAKGLLGELQEAIEDEDRAIKLDSTVQIFYTDRGFAKSGLRLYEAAIEDYSHSIRLTPNQKAYADRGFAFSQLGQQQKAIGDYTQALALSPNDYEIYYLRGLSYQAMGRLTEACADFAKSAGLGYAPAGTAQTKGCK